VQKELVVVVIDALIGGQRKGSIRLSFIIARIYAARKWAKVERAYLDF
jgi:hypothetical protein